MRQSANEFSRQAWRRLSEDQKVFFKLLAHKGWRPQYCATFVDRTDVEAARLAVRSGFINLCFWYVGGQFCIAASMFPTLYPLFDAPEAALAYWEMTRGSV